MEPVIANGQGRIAEPAAGSKPASAGRTVRYYAVVVAGIAALITTPFVGIYQPIWLLLMVPLVLVWGVWMLNEYWRWVRSLGK